MDIKPYRGPPPRKDLVLSPRREEDWKGNDLFKITTDMNSNSNRDEKQQTIGYTSDVAYGPQKTQRDYGNDYSKLALNGGRKGLLRMDNDEELSEERRQKGCGELSEYSRLARQGGHKDLLVIEENKRTERVEHHPTSGVWFEYNNNTSASPHRHNKSNNDTIEVKTPAEMIQQPIVRPKQMRINGCLPDGEELVKKSGKKRFDNSGRAEAPFATDY
ncbi:uncharacterized protein LOC100212865 isoform X1 [Hydra vulgaris]|uniref:uncharacterized protein LOC100212865 isoform X1 n=2 Tax=Hydra vulgaris TaxID=6087 RepID=UPI0001926A86|nr:uncharacterized protein LOC100212865 isoform X1 [Hydra vulgaris]